MQSDSEEYPNKQQNNDSITTVFEKSDSVDSPNHSIMSNNALDESQQSMSGPPQIIPKMEAVCQIMQKIHLNYQQKIT